MRTIAFLVCLAGVAPAAAQSGPSFDCAKASNEVELAICAILFALCFGFARAATLTRRRCGSSMAPRRDMRESIQMIGRRSPRVS